MRRPLSSRRPVERRTDDDQDRSGIQDGVTHQVNLTLIGRWAQQAQRLPSEDAGDSSGGSRESKRHPSQIPALSRVTHVKSLPSHSALVNPGTST